MSTAFKIDHIVIMVNDLAAASKDYASLGFTVLEGGTHEANPTHNALVVFADGVYLEIIALRGPKDEAKMSSRLRKWANAAPGLVDMALLPGDIEADVANARARGLLIEDPEPGGRLRPDGQQIVWQTANLKGAGLPFFCADVTPRSLRVPEGAAQQHANGVTGVADVLVAVTDLAVSTGQYHALLGLEPRSIEADETLAAKTTTFALASGSITLAQPATDASPLHTYLNAGGERPYRFTLHTEATPSSGTLDVGLTHGAHINLGVAIK